MSAMEETPARTRHSFTDEFKRDAVAMVLDDGNKIVEAADRLGIGEGTLGNWVRQAGIDRGERVGVTTSERAALTELRRENARLRMERDLLRRGRAFGGEGVGTVTRYRWVAARKAEGFPITMACKVAEVLARVPQLARSSRRRADRRRAG